MNHAIKDGRPVCTEPLDALCRAIWDCDCEWYYAAKQQPDGTWTHEGQVWDDETDERAICHSSLPAAPRWCNIVEWIDSQGIWDSWVDHYNEPWASSQTPDPRTGDYPMDLPDGLIRYEWGDEWLSWDYAEATPALGRFIARQIVGAWSEDVAS